MTQLLHETELRTGHIRVNGTDLYYEDTGGQGEPIIFSHALLLDSKLFAPQVAALRGKYRCISYDHRGQGRSAEDSASAIGLDILTEDVVALIETLKLGSVHFCGLSMGGFVGIRLAAKHPRLLRSLILMCSSADTDPAENLKKYKFLNFLGRWIGPWSVAHALAPVIFGKTTLSDPARKELKAQLITHLSRNRWSSWRAVNGVIFRESLHEELPKIMSPTLVIAGDEDLCMDPARSEQLATSICGAKFERIPNGGHAITIEQPVAVNAVIEEFLQSVSAESPTRNM
jgi:3-oxoadipate enol-lactonase